MLENEEFTGAFVKLPMGFFERIAVAAENHHQRLSQWVDTTTMDNTIAAINSWLSSLEQARTRPYPSAEPGDLLVKLKRGEFWTFTSGGWRELAPIELVTEQAYDVAAGHPEPEHVAADRDFLVGPSEAVRAGWQERAEEAAKTRRFFGRSVVEDELERIRAGEPFEPLKGADLLRSHAEVLFAAVDVIRDRARRDGGPEGDAFGEDPWTLEGLLGLAYGYEHAARIIGS